MNDQKNPLPRSGEGQPTSIFKRIPKRAVFFAICAVAAIIVYCVVNSNSLTALMDKFRNVLEPIAIGCGIAYLCNPILRLYESKLLKRMKKGGLRRGLALFFTVVTVLSFLAVILALIIPELVESITHLVNNYKTYVNNLLAFIQQVIDEVTKNLPDVNIDVSDVDKLMDTLRILFDTMGTGFSDVLDFLQKFMVDGNVMGNLWGFITGLVNTFFNLILGIFIAFYILSSKEKRVAQINKFRAAFLNEKQDRRVGEVIKLVDRTFGGFVRGTLLDALVVGLLVFVATSIFNVSKYNLLIAAICAITNIIPVFGPFIGAIPSALIVLISNPEHPIKLLIFVILILVIQQIDGNIILPRIQGNNTGISSLAVLIAITVMGGIFGMGGMIIGVPIFAVAIELVKQIIEERLKAKGAETDTTCYYPDDAIGNAVEDVHYEHAHLRYLYDHSRVKSFVDRSLHRNEEESEDEEEYEAEPDFVNDIANAPAESRDEETLIIPDGAPIPEAPPKSRPQTQSASADKNQSKDKGKNKNKAKNKNKKKKK